MKLWAIYIFDFYSYFYIGVWCQKIHIQMLLRLYTFYTISNKIYTEKIIFCLKIDNFNRNQLQYSRQSKSNDFYSYFNIIVIIRPLIFRMTGLWVVLLTYSDPVPCKCAPNPDIQQIKIQKHLTRIMSLHNLAFEFRE